MEKMNEAEIVLEMSKKFPNDQILGEEYRKLSLNLKGSLDEFCLKYPNDTELGNYLRKKVSK